MPTYSWVKPIFGTEPNTICRENDDGTLSYIPNDPANLDYLAFLEHEERQKEAAKAPKNKRKRS